MHRATGPPLECFAAPDRGPSLAGRYPGAGPRRGVPRA